MMWPFRKRNDAPLRRSHSRPVPKRRTLLTLELLERRELLSATGFLQGTAFIDLNSDHTLDANDTYLSGATISLYQGNTTTGPALATALTNNLGQYLFTGLTPGAYTLVETPPSTYFNSGAEALSQLDPASVVQPSTIHVTVLDPSTISLNVNVNNTFGRNLYDYLSYTLNGVPDTTAAAQIPVTASGKNTVTNSTDSSTFLSLCWDLNNSLDSGTNVFPVLPTSGQGAPQNAGQIAYLFNHYGTLDIGGASNDGFGGDNGAAASIASAANLPVNATAEAAGLQVAVWELEYGASFANLAGILPYTSAAELTAINSYAAFYQSVSANKSETATFLQVDGPPSQGGEQGLIATGSFDFGNQLKAQPAITTVASESSNVVGSAVLTDTADLTGGYNITGGTITFHLTDPNGNPVTLPASDTSVAVTGPGDYTTPAGVTATLVGNYVWSASYSGDGDNLGAVEPATTTEMANETVATIKAQPAITTVASETSGGVVGSAVLTDTADLTGGYNITGGTITFHLTDPNGNPVTLPASDTSVAVTGPGDYTTPLGVTATLVGNYVWSASYSGDGDNLGAVEPVTTTEKANETVTTVQAQPAITTVASESGNVVGGAVLTDTADLTGGYNITAGTITFHLTDPNGNPVTLPPSDASVAVTGPGYYSTPAGVTATLVGNYVWSASYSGDGDNLGAVEPVTTTEKANETVTTVQAQPAITTVASESGNVVGGAVLTDTADLTGGYNITAGTITFHLTDPNGNPVTLPPSDASVAVTGPGYYSTPAGVTATLVGNYVWSASYSGDGDNLGAVEPVTTTEKANETVTTVQAQPAITTVASESGNVVGGAVLTDTADLTGGYNITAGTITFHLTDPNGNPVTLPPSDASVAVTGPGYYSTPAGVTATLVGNYVWSASYSGDGDNLGAVEPVTTTEKANETVTTVQAQPAITTVASESGNVVGGAVLTDTADLTGGYNITAGTITFHLTDPNGNPVTLPPSDASVAVTGPGYYSTPAGVTATLVGNYVWSASYSGDGDNLGAVEPVTTTEKANETVTTVQAQPAITTVASETSGGVVGSAVLTDTADLTGGYNITGGTITFHLTDPNGNPVTLPPSDASVAVTGPGYYSTPAGVTATLVGNYVWSASYSGDGDNLGAVEPVTTTEKANETVTTVQAQPAITTVASESGNVVGGAVLTDTADLTGGYNITGGTITFHLTDPNGNPVTLPSADTSVAVTGPGDYTTPLGVTATLVGNYVWSASYSGDGDNLGAVEPVTTTEKANETVTTVQAQPAITTVASESGNVVGGAVLTDTADLTGGYNITGGTITFHLTDPNGNPVTLPSADTSVAVTGPGDYTTPLGVTATLVGNYVWSASYSGDGDNLGAVEPVTTTEMANETVATIKAQPAITTVASETSGGVVGSAVLTDTADLTGGYNITGGTITFHLTDPNGNPVTLPASDTSVAVTGPGYYSTPAGVTATLVGNYVWSASYSGDADNLGAVEPTTTTEKANETVTTVQASPCISTTPGGSVSLGSGVKLTDSATLSGGYKPGGSITFYLFAPNVTPNGTNSNNVYCDTVTVSGDNTYTTSQGGNPGGYLPMVVGTYEWVAIYSGDGNNKSAVSAFGCEPETVGGSTISGTKFLDATGNGFSGDDTGLGGVTIDLYLESNKTAGLQTGAGGDTLVTTTKTATGTGAYSFTNLAPGTYYVQEVVPPIYIQTGGGPNGSAGCTYYTFTVQAGQTYTGANFDDYLIPTCAPTCVSYTINGCNTVSDLRGNTQEGDTVTVTFTVTKGMSDQLTLVSYVAPGSTFNAATAYQQQIYSEATGVFTAGVHTLTVRIPDCYYQIDFVCGPAINELGPPNYGPDSSNIFYSAQDRLISADNGGCQASPPVQCGDFATIGFWHNNNGQALIKSLNGGATSTLLAQWLATELPNLYGAHAGATSLVNSNGTYFTNTQVAAAYLSSAFFGASGQKTNAQILATALGVYVTNTTLAGGNMAAAYGFNTSLLGTGIDALNVGSNGAAFKVANNSSQTVLQLLLDLNGLASNGSFSTSLANAANAIFSTVNQDGDIN